MSPQNRVIFENVIFGPWFFFFVILVLAFWFFRKPSPKWFSYSLIITWGLLFLFCSSPFFKFFSYPLKQMIPPSVKQPAQAIVVASAGIHQTGAPSPGSAMRAYTAAKLYLAGLAPLVIITGGIRQPFDAGAGSRGMYIILRGMGIPAEDIIVEDQSFNTYENGVMTAKILNERHISEILLVSHDYHLPRLNQVFQKLGFRTHSYAANLHHKTQSNGWWTYLSWSNFNQLRTIAHEYIGITFYKLTGKS